MPRFDEQTYRKRGQVESDRFRAEPRREIPEDEKPTPAMRRAQAANIKKAQAAVRTRRKAATK